MKLRSVDDAKRIWEPAEVITAELSARHRWPYGFSQDVKADLHGWAAATSGGWHPIQLYTEPRSESGQFDVRPSSTANRHRSIARAETATNPNDRSETQVKKEQYRSADEEQRLLVLRIPKLIPGFL